MKQFSRGQKSKLDDLGCGQSFNVEVDLRIAGASADVSCFGLDSADRLSDDRYMVFYNQLASPGDAVRLTLAGERASFAVNLAALPATISKLVFTAALDGGAIMRALSQGSVTLGGVAQFALAGADFQEEKAVILAELYRKDGLWRFGAVGQGFNGGMSALLAHFGGSEVAAPAPAPAPAPQARVSLSKVTLEKRGDKISLEKSASRGFGRIHVNLNWNRSAAVAPAEKGGFLAKLTGGARASKGLDLDLACMYELTSGSKGVVQALGNSFGDFNSRPYIQLAADDRTGASVDGENLTINGQHFDEIKRALIFAFIYEGAPNWASTDGVVTVNVPDQPPIEVRLDQGASQRMCAIAMIENVGGKLQVTKLVDYIVPEGGKSMHEVMDRKYNFGMKWVAGSKS
ncbi:tellurite resistance protein TerA [Duganella sp. 1411]|uniref:TerD family protein n=1 Tax=Duganella sp. 1411 TaxID=2806572 RepID=UPI001AEAA963|nr:TerD family protein [Duganella sp. 1411]MBP1203538.1 tellurite resistance protein TerA [Duganella sp. 1411]